MLRNYWYPIYASADLKRKPVQIRRFGEAWVLWRDGSCSARLMPAHCPHRGAALAQGRIVDGELECPWHGFRFDGDGRCTQVPCEGEAFAGAGRLGTFSVPVREHHGLLWAAYGDETAEEMPLFPLMDQDTRCSEEAAVELPYHYSRMVETNLDIHHTPFVHRSVLPGLGARVVDTAFSETDAGFEFAAALARSDGSRKMPFSVEFIRPNLVRVALSEKLQLVVAATPIDEASSWVWFRYYQLYTSLPLVRKLVSWAMVRGELGVVQKQDWRIFSAMSPGPVDNVSYRLVGADKPIAAYLKWRSQALREQNSAPLIARTQHA